MKRGASPASLEHFERTRRFLAGGSSTNSKVHQSAYEPVVAKRGKGCRIWNLDGREFIDFKNGLGPVTVGYGVDEINEAIVRQLDDGIVFGAPHRLEGMAAEELARVVPCAEEVRFLKTGGEAIAAAIKIARASTGRDDIVQCGYNGWLNTVSAGPAFTQRIDRRQALAGVPVDISKHYAALPWNVEDAWQDLLRAHSDTIAAVVVATDYKEFFAGRTFLPFLRRLTRDHGVLMIMDEIVMGFRVALGGAHEYFDFDPDMAVFGKGMTNGMPLSAYCGRRELMELAPGLGISSTNGGEALSLAALLKVIEIYEREQVVDYLAAIGERMWAGVGAILAEEGITAELHGHPAAKFFEFSDPRMEKTFFSSCFREGVSLYNPAYVSFSHTEKDIEEALQKIAGAAKAAKDETG